MAEQSRQKEWLQGKIDEYTKLGPELLKLGEKSTHEVMVPISEIAFFPKGKIKHSNEFLVAIGDNYFLERTSQECQPILGRRIQKLQEQLDVVNRTLEKDLGLQKIMQEKTQKKKWVGLDGQPTDDDNVTHWDENGFLDIREEYDAENDTSGHDTDHDVLRSDQITNIGAPIARSPADIRKMMDKVQKESERKEEQKVQALEPVIKEEPQPQIQQPPSRQLPYSTKVLERNSATQIPFDNDTREEAPRPKKKSKFRQQMMNQ